MARSYRTDFITRLLVVGRLLIVTMAFGSLGCEKAEADRQVAGQDAFLSYWQSAAGLATGLKKLDSREAFMGPLSLGPPAPLKDQDGPGRTMKDMLDALCTQVEGYGGAVQALPPETIRRLNEKHHALVTETKKLIEESSNRHAESPEILGADWDRYRTALQSADGGK